MANETKTDIGISDGPTPVTPLPFDRAGVGALTPIMESTYRMESDETVRSRFPKPEDNETGISHPYPQRSNSQDNLRPRPTTLPPSMPTHSGSGHTISTPVTPIFLKHLNNLPEISLSSIPDVYQQYIQEKADQILQEIVPEPVDSERHNCVTQEDITPGEQDTQHHLFPAQRMLHPLSREHLEIGPDGCYYERRNYNRVDNDLLGEGGFGMVYACHDICKDTLFAIKCNNQSTEDKTTTMAKECDMLNSIGPHGHITRYFGSLVDDYGPEAIQGEMCKMLMECATNGNLYDMLFDPETNECSGLPVDQCVYYLQQILFAVHYLHQHNTLHLDLKCKNILVFNDGRTVKVTDFGSAIRMDALEVNNSLVGCTPNFSAPEVIHQQQLASFSADIWSVMCVLIEMMTGKLPWSYWQDLEQQMVIVMVGQYDEKHNFNYLVPCDKLQLDESVVQILKSVLKRDPKYRPTALQLLREPIIISAHEYEKFFDGYEYEMYPDTPPYPPLTDETDCKDIPNEVNNHNVLCQVQNGVQTDESNMPNSKRISVDSGTGSSVYNRLSTGSFTNSSATPSPGSIDGKKVPCGTISSRYQISRHESAPVLSHTTPVSNLVARYEEISKHRPSIGSPSLTHSSSAPPDVGGWDMRLFRLSSRGGDDNEKDGFGTRVLKRSTSAQYVSNGPEADCPNHRQTSFSLPPGVVKAPLPQSLTFHSGSDNGVISRVSVGTQTSSSPTIEVRPPLLDPQTISIYTSSQMSVVRR